MSTARGPRDRRTSRAGSRPTAPARRTSSRPGGRSRAASLPSGRQAPVHVRRLITLGVLLVVMALVVAPALSGFLRQRADISALKQEIADEQDEIAGLETELERWEDDDYVEQQARERLRFVKEGETAFTVIDDTGSDYTETLPGMAPVSDDVIADSPWYGQVWESVKIANEGLPETTEP
ncbi:Cell division protein DivIC (FtsB), stabilizes FtsL against RasP cleavage [Serinicoccus hydrothermalis]|uniref:Cell division protein DivIC (FtsB), stabilizes FtsL against RasP cleavage n=1 Tax=Serinicoccus hydrothermalis TaxID=1758689 RepID=A0A1B1NBC0_9MICO|nr:septum formation initiator family protein [Serinicoccus hydrothermalis]ANS78726.1 Cell division protein DivIC (FtsB), stabilizes FtsL against RasP cleavage [Serinicoccus hydrothermalis]